MAYKTLFSGLGIHHCNTGMQVTPVLFMKELFMLLVDLKLNCCVSSGHSSPSENCKIRIELKFDKPVAEVGTILNYQEFESSVQIELEISLPVSELWIRSTSTAP